MNEIWSDIAVEVFSVSLAAYVAYRVAKLNNSVSEYENTISYLSHFLDELEYNQKLLNEMKNMLRDGPAIDKILDPAAVISQHFRLQAWDALVRAGLLRNLPLPLQIDLNYTDRHIRDVIWTVQTKAAGWQRIIEWNKYYDQNGVPHQTPVKDYLLQAINDCKTANTNAQTHTEAAIKKVEDYLEELELNKSRQLRTHLKRYARKIRGSVFKKKKAEEIEHN
ncbi:hypothetical protein POF51_29650 [Brevibacillus sp. AG]|uniref:hypothetical protein n=1 Tax=Brevibacillus sp. AG TaxID=3020891 RepID=UPI00232DBD26|nr:hypothetical protein [Brevibacillus sp. AG]MDC0764889.1 hypothetical protein [Brevibacillus sp. AG]